MNDLLLLSRQIGVSERTLRRAFNEGAIHGQRLSPRRLKLSAGERSYVLSKWSLIARLRAVLRTEPNVSFALLFGSAARGDDTPASDIDLLVEARDPSLVRLVDLGMKLEAALDRKVDILALEDAEESPPLLAEALRDGRVLIDRNDRWPKLRARRERKGTGSETRSRQRRQRALAAIDRLRAEI
jgi:predicted nucleotidyltransferase